MDKKDRNQQWYLKHKEDRLVEFALLQATPIGRASHLLSNAKRRAKAKGIPFNLTKEWMAEQLRSGECPRTGCEFDYDPMPKAGEHNPFAPSIDRIDSSKGYTMDNTQIVIWGYNTAKHTWSDETTVRIAQAIASMDLVNRLTQQH